MHLGNQGTAFLPEGGILPGGQYPVYASLEADDDGVALGELHFACEPKHPPPISIGEEFDVHVPHPQSILGDREAESQACRRLRLRYWLCHWFSRPVSAPRKGQRFIRRRRRKR